MCLCVSAVHVHVVYMGCICGGYRCVYVAYMWRKWRLCGVYVTYISAAYVACIGCVCGCMVYRLDACGVDAVSVV